MDSLLAGFCLHYQTVGEDWWTTGTSYEGYITYAYDDAVNNGLTVTDITTLGPGTSAAAGQPNTGTPGAVLSQLHFNYDEMDRVSSVRDDLRGKRRVRIELEYSSRLV